MMDDKKIEDVTDIVVKYLEDNGFDGLCNDEYECICIVDALAPCGEGWGSCMPGYKVEGCTSSCGEGCDFHITTVKPGKEKNCNVQNNNVS